MCIPVTFLFLFHKHSVSETGSVSVVRRAGIGEDDQMSALERYSLNHWNPYDYVSHSVMSDDGDRSSLRNVFLYSQTKTMDNNL
jgi:hypothetical protein